MTLGLLRRARAEQGGWALVTTMILLGVMTAGGMATVTIMDTQTQQSAQERRRETAFNLAEAALNGQVFSLARDWPGQGMAANPYPTCTPGASSPRCPAQSQLQNLMGSQDVLTGANWQTTVRDNGASGGQSFYSDALTQTQPGYDANGDGKLWVRASATASGKTRTIVALVRAEQQDEDVPHGALIAGRLENQNDGNKVIVDASASGAADTVQVRCKPVALDPSPCLGQPTGLSVQALFDWLGSKTQILPVPTIANTGYQGGAAMTADARARLRARAIADGTYYTGCPTAAQLTGAVVYVESGDCRYTSNTQYNSQGRPGLLIFNSGSLYLGGTSDFWGVIYHANAAGSSAVLVETQGNMTVHGGVLIDGPGVMHAGASGANVALDLNAYNAVKSYGSAGVIQNTWREIKG
jgi:Tfp pilus assembly protein PilX